MLLLIDNPRTVSRFRELVAKRRGAAVSDERADPILNMLRSIRTKQDQHDQKFDELITRLSALERDFAGMKLDFAGVHARLDNVGRRLDRVERRLELVDEPTC